MRRGGAVGAGLAALVLAVLPGLLRLAPSERDLERAPLVRVGETASALPAAAPAPVPAAVPATVPPAPPAPVEVAAVPITPPTGPLTGEVAPPGPPPGTFAPAVTHDPDGEVVALVVGIDDYPGHRADLGAAVADADLVDAALERFGIPRGSRVVLRDGQATRDQLVASLAALASSAGPGSTLVFAFAGHVQKLDHDTEALVAADGGLVTDEELAALLAPAQASRAWLLLATCFAGGFVEALAPGRILTGAAGADELAYESPELDASFLVHHLVREGWLERRAGPSVQSAFSYADRRIAESHPDRRPVQVDQAQEPLVLDRTGGEPGPQATTASAPAGGGGGGGGSPPPPPPEEEGETSCILGVALCRRR